MSRSIPSEFLDRNPKVAAIVSRIAVLDKNIARTPWAAAWTMLHQEKAPSPD